MNDVQVLNNGMGELIIYMFIWAVLGTMLSYFNIPFLITGIGLYLTKKWLGNFLTNNLWIFIVVTYVFAILKF